MQTILIILTLLLLALPCQAQEMVSRLNVGTLGGGVAAAATKFPCQDATHLGDTTAVTLCEDFEGGASCESGSSDENCRNTWVAWQACNTTWDYSYTAAPLAGTNSSYGVESGNGSLCGKRSAAFTASDNVYIYARVKMPTITLPDSGNYAFLLAIGNSTGAGDFCDLFVTNVDGTNIRWSVYTISTRTDAASGPTAGTEYHVWLEFQKNTANGCKLYVSETSTKPAVTVETSITSENAQGETLVLAVEDGATEFIDMIIDNIAISTSGAFSNM